MSNDFLPFAVGGTANVETQSDYVADTSTLQNGFSSGVANSSKLNKVWRQSSIMSAVLGQFIVNQSGQNAVDDGTTATLIANLLAAIRSATKTGVILADTGAANAYTAVNAPPLVAGTWVDGVVQQVKIAHANTGASTYAPDGLTAIAIYGLGLQPLQGGELALNGTAILMHATIAGVNSGNPIAVLMECAGGAQQVAPATQSQHAVQFQQVVGVIGSSSNLSLQTTSGTAFTLTADQIIVGTALNGLIYAVNNASHTFNAATTGLNGMDTGSLPAAGCVAIYEVVNPTTGAKGLLGQALASIASVAPSIYGGSNPVAGFTASALVAVLRTSSSAFVTTKVIGRKHITTLGLVAGTTTPAASPTSITLTGVPGNAKNVSGFIIATNSVAGVQVTYALSADANTLGSIEIAGANPNAGGQIISPGALDVYTPQTAFYTLSVGSGTPNCGFNCTSYTI